MNKVIKKENKKIEKKTKGRISAEGLTVLSAKYLLKEENLNNIADVVSGLLK